MLCYEDYSLQHCITFQIKDQIGLIKKANLISKKVIKNRRAHKIQIIKVVAQLEGNLISNFIQGIFRRAFITSKL